MKRVFINLSCLFFFTGAIAQNQPEFGINLKTGLGEMKNLSSNNIDYPNTITTKLSPSWGVGITGKKQISRWFSVEGQLEYNQINGNEEEIYGYSEGMPISGEWVWLPKSVSSTSTRKANYASFNALFKVHPEPTYSFGLGVSINALVSNSLSIKTYENNQPISIIGSGNDMARLDIGIHPQFAYKLGQRLEIVAQAYFGLINSRTGEYRDYYSASTGFDSGQRFNVKNRQYTIGLNYSIFKK